MSANAPVMAFPHPDDGVDNSDLIVSCVSLDYLRTSDYVLDCTYGLGNFWKLWKPWPGRGGRLVGTDLNPKKMSDTARALLWSLEDMPMPGVDFTNLERYFKAREFDAVVFDPPYKLNGTPDPDLDGRYGVDQPTKWQDRMALCHEGIKSAAHVAKRHLLIKCQDQVCSGKVRWQTIEFSDQAVSRGFELVDMLHLPSYRPQPPGRSQVHARRNYSTMLVLERRNQ